MRVTMTSILRRLSGDIGRNSQRVDKVSRQISSGKRINKPSDDPLGAVKAMQLKDEGKRLKRFEDNAREAQLLLDIAEETLDSITQMMQRIRVIAVQGASEVLTEKERKDLAFEVDRLIEEMINTANTRYQGSYLFGGTENTKPPFLAQKNNGQIVDVIYQGNDESNYFHTGIGQLVSVGVDGSPCYEAIKTAIDLRDHLLANDFASVSTDMETVERVLEKVLLGRADIGARQKALAIVENRLLDSRMRVEEDLSLIEDTDIAEAAIKLQAYEVNYQASIKVFANIISQPSLVDYVT